MCAGHRPRIPHARRRVHPGKRRRRHSVLRLLQSLDAASAHRGTRRIEGHKRCRGLGRLSVGDGCPFRPLLDLLNELDIADNTIVVFAGDNGPEDTLPWRGTAGFWDGSYFTGMEGSLRTPCLIRWPGHVAAGRVSNEIVHVTDMFTTLLAWAGCDVASDRIIDGVDQRAFFGGEQDQSNRQGFLFWNGDKLYGVGSELQTRLRRTTLLFRRLTALRQPTHHQPAHRSQRTRTRRLAPPAHLGRRPLHQAHRAVPGQRETRTADPVAHRSTSSRHTARSDITCPTGRQATKVRQKPRATD